MLISELAKQVHENAVAHGWWEENREAPEINALIHSEWSEALEEARAGRPLVWYDIYDRGDDCGGGGRCSAMVNEGVCSGRNGKCERNHKPEGVAVELIDGCIRILDYMGELGVTVQDCDSEADSEIEGLYTDEIMAEAEQPTAHVVAWLHMLTSEALSDARENALLGDMNPMKLLSAMALALSWVKKQGLDPLAILLEKHEYNKTRPYKHGKKF